MSRLMGRSNRGILMAMDRSPYIALRCGDATTNEQSQAADRIEQLEAFVGRITDAGGPYTDLDGHRIVADAYAALGDMGKES